MHPPNLYNQADKWGICKSRQQFKITPDWYWAPVFKGILVASVRQVILGAVCRAQVSQFNFTVSLHGFLLILLTKQPNREWCPRSVGCAVRHLQLSVRTAKIPLGKIYLSWRPWCLPLDVLWGYKPRASHFKAVVKPKNEHIFCEVSLLCTKLSKSINLMSHTGIVPRASFLIILGLVKGVVS